MPKNPVTDLITDQEMAFARLILSGTMTDRDAAQAAGLNPSTAAYTKSKPTVRAYMAEHRAALLEKLAEDEARKMRRLNQDRDHILERLWQLANLSHEQTNGSISGQIKAMSMIAAIEGVIPGRRPVPIAHQVQPHPQPVRPQPQPFAPPPPPTPADAVADRVFAAMAPDYSAGFTAVSQQPAPLPWQKSQI